MAELRIENPADPARTWLRGLAGGVGCDANMVRIAPLFCLLGSVAVSLAQGLFPVGVARVDITAERPIRLSGFAVRTKPSDPGTYRLSATALALGSTNNQSLCIAITVDNLGIPEYMTAEVHSQLSRKFALKREQFAISATHTHSAPMLTKVAPNLFAKDILAEEQKEIDRYTKELTAKLVEVSISAVEQQKMGELWFGRGVARFGANRRPQGGPVDHDVPVLGVKSAAGVWSAIWVNYACHCTTLVGDFNQQCGDWATFGQEEIERKFRSSKSLVAIGCGADINPNPRGTLANAEQHGRELAQAVAVALQGDMKRLRDLPVAKRVEFTLPFDTLPTKAEWEQRSSKPGITGYHARKNLARVNAGERIPAELPYSLQSWVFGRDLAIVFMPGEVVVDYILRVKKEYGAERVWINAYSNDAPCYIPSEQILAEGGYEGGGAMPYYDQPTKLATGTEERIFEQMRTVLPASYKQ